MATQTKKIAALDVGSARIGVAINLSDLKIAKPLTWWANDENFSSKLKELIKSEDISTLVVGLPRNLNGQDTEQTKYVREFVDQLEGVEVVLQDEALTSQKAEQSLQDSGKKYEKGDIDALAASFILQDYLETI